MAAPMSFFGGGPLGAAKTIPAVPRPNVPSSVIVNKRVASTSANGPSKRVKSTPTPTPVGKTSATPSATKPMLERPRAPLTPQPSSEDAPRSGISFKIPALPARLAPLTPTTSTVAASSSPRRLPSSPRHSSKPAQTVFLEAGNTLIFGRHHVRGTKPPVGPAPESIAAKLADASAPARTVILDRAARHASRVHAAVELIDNSIRIVVAGQNGMRIRLASGGKFRRLPSGSTESFPQTTLELDFYGASVLLRTDDPDETEDERLFTPPPEEVTRAASPLSLPPSSPPLMPMEMDDEESEHEASVEQVPGPSEGPKRLSRSSSPLSEPEAEAEAEADAESEVEIMGVTAPTSETIAIKTELLEATQAVATTAPSRPASPRKSRASTPIEIPPFPEGIDLPALLASTVVFSGSSKLSLPDLVKSLLESQPSLREYSPEVWSVWASRELESNGMFGKITRNGRDSSGRPLQSHYFYNPANDPDAGRAAELGGLVRPLRAAQRSGGKTIDWRPVGGGRRRY